MNTTIRCFVAMAVGRPDTDRIYDKHILPTLRAAGIHAIFMGRLEHNDDIDKRIIREIEASDFVIAPDLCSAFRVFRGGIRTTQSPRDLYLSSLRGHPKAANEGHLKTGQR
jgi:hypothetical protein